MDLNELQLNADECGMIVVGNKIAAIKAVRERLSLSLYEAKAIVDRYSQTPEAMQGEVDRLRNEVAELRDKLNRHGVLRGAEDLISKYELEMPYRWKDQLEVAVNELVLLTVHEYKARAGRKAMTNVIRAIAREPM